MNNSTNIFLIYNFEITSRILQNRIIYPYLKIRVPLSKDSHTHIYTFELYITRVYYRIACLFSFVRNGYIAV